MTSIPKVTMFARRIGTLLIAASLGLLLAAPSAFAQDKAASDDDPPVQASRPVLATMGYTALAVLANVAYIPAKVSYAAIGGVCSAGTYILTMGRKAEAKRTWRIATRGDYVLTPSMMEGEEPINFSGPDVADANSQATADASMDKKGAGEAKSSPLSNLRAPWDKNKPSP